MHIENLSCTQTFSVMRIAINRLYLVLLIFMISTYTYGQTSLNIGYTNTITQKSSATLNQSSKNRINGVSASLAYDFTFPKLFGFNIGLGYTYSFDREGDGGNDKFTGYKTNYHTLDIPIRLMVNIPFSDKSKAFVFAGPRATFDISGTIQPYLAGEKIGDLINIYGDKEISTIEDIKELNPKRLNILAGAGVGLKLDHFIIRGGYDLGLIDINKDDASKNIYKLRKNMWYITLGIAL